MKEVLMSIDWVSLFQAIWTIVLVPLGTYAGKVLHDWAADRQIEKYTDMLYKAVDTTVKDLYQTMVDEAKGTDIWTKEYQQKIKEIAITKVKQALTTKGYEILRAANTDFEAWVESLIEAAVYEEKGWVD